LLGGQREKFIRYWEKKKIEKRKYEVNRKKEGAILKRSVPAEKELTF